TIEVHRRGFWRRELHGEDTAAITGVDGSSCIEGAGLSRCLGLCGGLCLFIGIGLAPGAACEGDGQGSGSKPSDFHAVSLLEKAPRQDQAAALLRWLRHSN